MAMSTESSTEGYGDSTWDYKTIFVQEEQIASALAQESAGGWECLGITARASAPNEYLLILRSKKSMAGM